MSKTNRNAPCPCGSKKKFKNCCLRKLGNPFVDVYSPASESPVFKYVMGEGLEDLTDEKITELVNRGWPREDLEWAKEKGYRYCSDRDSIFCPPVTNIDDLDDDVPPTRRPNNGLHRTGESCHPGKVYQIKNNILRASR